METGETCFFPSRFKSERFVIPSQKKAGQMICDVSLVLLFPSICLPHVFLCCTPWTDNSAICLLFFFKCLATFAELDALMLLLRLCLCLWLVHLLILSFSPSPSYTLHGLTSLAWSLFGFQVLLFSIRKKIQDLFSESSKVFSFFVLRWSQRDRSLASYRAPVSQRSGAFSAMVLALRWATQALGFRYLLRMVVGHVGHWNHGPKFWRLGSQ